MNNKSKIFSIVLLISVLLIQGCTSTALKPGEPAPYTILYMANGKDKLLSQYKGKTVAMIFWATWCNYSKYAMDDFRDKAAKYTGRDDVVFLAVSLDESREEYDERIQVRNYTENITHVFSGNGPLDETYLRFGAPAIPLVYTIGPDGVIRTSGRRLDLEED